MLSELNTLLEKIPVWKRLQSLPAEMDVLKQRVAELESLLKEQPDDACPSCHQRTYKLARTEQDPDFGMSVQYRIYECSACGHTESKTVY